MSVDLSTQPIADLKQCLVDHGIPIPKAARPKKFYINLIQANKIEFCAQEDEKHVSSKATKGTKRKRPSVGTSQSSKMQKVEEAATDVESDCFGDWTTPLPGGDTNYQQFLRLYSKQLSSFRERLDNTFAAAEFNGTMWSVLKAAEVKACRVAELKAAGVNLGSEATHPGVAVDPTRTETWPTEGDVVVFEHKVGGKLKLTYGEVLFIEAKKAELSTSMTAATTKRAALNKIRVLPDVNKQLEGTKRANWCNKMAQHETSKFFDTEKKARLPVLQALDKRSQQVRAQKTAMENKEADVSFLRRSLQELDKGINDERGVLAAAEQTHAALVRRRDGMFRQISENQVKLRTLRLHDILDEKEETSSLRRQLAVWKDAFENAKGAAAAQAEDVKQRRATIAKWEDARKKLVRAINEKGGSTPAAPLAAPAPAPAAKRSAPTKPAGRTAKRTKTKSEPSEPDLPPEDANDEDTCNVM